MITLAEMISYLAVASAPISAAIGIYYKHKLEEISRTHQIRFSKLHECRAQALADTYSALQDSVDGMMVYVRKFKTDRETEGLALENAWNTKENFRKIFSRSKIYFSPKLSRELEEIDSKIFVELMTFSTLSSTKDSEVTCLSLEQFKSIQDLIRQALPHLEAEMRNVLGSNME